jgi:hypothetical protein
MWNQTGKPSTIIVKTGNIVNMYIIWFPGRNRLAILDILKVADILIFVSSSNSFLTLNKNNFDSSFYSYVSDLFTLLKSQGPPYIILLLQGLNSISLKKRMSIIKNYEVYFRNKFPKFEKIFQCDSENELIYLWNFLSLKKYFNLEWRHRGYILGQSFQFKSNLNKDGILEIIGYLHSSNFVDINCLVHITGIGDFQIKSIEVISKFYNKNISELNIFEFDTNRKQENLELISNMDYSKKKDKNDLDIQSIQ